MPDVNCGTIADVRWTDLFDRVNKLTSSAHIWRLCISSNTDLCETHHSLLTLAEAERARSYHFQRDRFRFILSRAALRILLGTYSGQHPGDIQLAEGNNKKPYIIHNGSTNLHFNLAHAGDFILFIFSGTHCGVDVEYNIADFVYDTMLEDYFTSKEQLYVKNHSSPRLAFNQLWTKKEALTKATSIGVDDLRTIPCLDGQHTIASTIIGSEKNWNVTHFEVAEEYPAAVACESATPDLLFFEAASFLRALK